MGYFPESGGVIERRTIRFVLRRSFQLFRGEGAGEVKENMVPVETN